MLGDRKANVLKHTINDFVRTNIPVSSERLASRLGLSSASVRNELHRLTDLGFLAQPHTSAGRVPTDEGYRFFVDNLLEDILLADEEEERMRQGLDVLQFKLEQFMRDMAELLASWTQCIGFVSVTETNRSVLTRLELTEVSPHGLLMLVVLRNGLVENRLVELPVSVRSLPLDTISRMLNERLSGRCLQDVTPDFLDEVFGEVRLYEETVRNTVKLFLSDLMFSMEQRLYMDGARQLMTQPEFQDTRQLRPVLDVVLSAHSFPGLLDVAEGRAVDVAIGRENVVEELFSCSVLKSRFTFSDRTVGTVGIVGPKRMDYPRLMGLVRYLAESLSRSLRQFPIS